MNVHLSIFVFNWQIGTILSLWAGLSVFDVSAYNGNGLPGTCLNTDVCIEVLRLVSINPAG